MADVADSTSTFWFLGSGSIPMVHKGIGGEANVVWFLKKTLVLVCSC